MLTEKDDKTYRALEFFAGIGLARAGMNEAGIDVVWANDIDETKCALYRAQWGSADICNSDVFDIDIKNVPDADIAWASSPCTDVSLAGKRGGLIEGRQSSAFFGFTGVLEKLGKRKPNAVVLENVCGLASSNSGNDFRLVIEKFNELGYSIDAFELNARRWLPQSRPRMFVVGLMDPIDGGNIDTSIRPDRLAWIHSDNSLKTHLTPVRSIPKLLSKGFTDLTDSIDLHDSRWWSQERVDSFVASLSQAQALRFERLKKGEAVARTAYRRTRNGRPVWEIREDDIAGCLRTARGGSSKQAVLFLGEGKVHIRWMTGNEYAKLQGVDDFAFDGFRESQVQYAFGDAVAVPVVEWLMKTAVIPALEKNEG